MIVAFSGGRDSSYGLHYVKNVLGMNPIAFTYDWGMVTDLARRNCARVCGKLGVEHIIRSADITAKRRYVRKNIEAWLKKPELGMVTLFMAGDKEFYCARAPAAQRDRHQARHLLHRQPDRGGPLQDRPHGRAAGRRQHGPAEHVAAQQGSACSGTSRRTT